MLQIIQPYSGNETAFPRGKDNKRRALNGVSLISPRQPWDPCETKKNIFSEEQKDL